MRPTSVLLCALVAAVALSAGCDVGEKDEPAPAPPPPVETADPLPKLPPDWSRHVNRAAGFAIGVPEGWSADDRRASSLFRSGDRLVAVSVSADRGQGGLALPVERFAERVADALPGFKRLRTDAARPYRARYEAAVVTATGDAAKSGVPQRLLVVVQRREGLATYTVLVAQNARVGDKAHRDEVRRMVRSLRGRPVRR